MIISTPPIVTDRRIDGEAGREEEESSQFRQWTLEPVFHGQRVDKVLTELVPEFSRSYLQQLLADGALTLAGRICTKASTKVLAGQALGFELRPTEQSQAFRPEAMPIDIVYQDEHLLVINKPAGLVVHPGAGNWSGTLLNGLLALHPCHAALPRAGIVHRLDKDTSGLMVVARSRQAMDRLVERIAAREVHREYLALAHRAWVRPDQSVCEAPIGRDPKQRQRMAVVDLALHPGKEAITRFEHLASSAQDGGFCLVKARLLTGRTHQIRVHMSHWGHPLVADAVYGGAAAWGMQRQALHARALGFAHPITEEPLHFRCAMPVDFSQALSQLGWATIATEESGSPT